MDGQDHVFVVNRRDITDEEKETSSSAPSIIKFDTAGDVVGSWGDQTTVPNSIHGCFVDRPGNVWVAGNSDGMVQKYSPRRQAAPADRHSAAVRHRRRQRAAAKATNTAQRSAATCRRHGDRSGQRRHLCRRRLRQPARRGVRQGGQVPAPVGPPGDAGGNAEGRRRRVRRGGALRRHRATPGWSTCATARATACRCSTRSATSSATSGSATAGTAARQARHGVVDRVLARSAAEVHVRDERRATSRCTSSITRAEKILSSFGRPGHQLGDFTHGHTHRGRFARQHLRRGDELGPAHPEVQGPGRAVMLTIPSPRTNAVMLPLACR